MYVKYGDNANNEYLEKNDFIVQLEGFVSKGFASIERMVKISVY